MLQDGEKVGNYRILRKIGSGGMGHVYLAEHPLIGKRVALKVLHPELAARDELLARFTNEARAVGHVAGEHVVEVHDFGHTPDGACFFVMEYLEGRTLAAELMEHGALGVPRALHIGAQLAAALGAIHSQSVIHRDLKPDNIMLIDRNGDPDFLVLLDFGLVKFLGEAATGPDLTVRGMVLGTPHYMSPEAAAARGPVDHRADQYAVGVLLFQMLTGQLPFQGVSSGEVLVRQATEPPPPLRALNPDVPPAVEQIVLRCLAKEPVDRFADDAALLAALMDADAYLASGAPVVPTRSVPMPAQAQGKSPQQNQSQPTAAMFAPPRERVEEARARAASGPQPNVPANHTMAIATPPAHRGTSRPRWPARVAIASTMAVVGAIAGVHLASRGSVPRAAVAVNDAGVEASPKPIPTVHLNIASEPPGATVYDERGQVLGKTPLDVEVPRSDQARTIRLSHPLTSDRITSVVPSSDVRMELELDPLPAKPARASRVAPDRSAPARHSHRDRGNPDGVLRPTF